MAQRAGSREAQFLADAGQRNVIQKQAPEFLAPPGAQQVPGRETGFLEAPAKSPLGHSEIVSQRDEPVSGEKTGESRVTEQFDEAGCRFPWTPAPPPLAATVVDSFWPRRRDRLFHPLSPERLGLISPEPLIPG
jgi:hypothetical protein